MLFRLGKDKQNQSRPPIPKIIANIIILNANDNTSRFAISLLHLRADSDLKQNSTTTALELNFGVDFNYAANNTPKYHRPFVGQEDKFSATKNSVIAGRFSASR